MITIVKVGDRIATIKALRNNYGLVGVVTPMSLIGAKDLYDRAVQGKLDLPEIPDFRAAGLVEDLRKAGCIVNYLGESIVHGFHEPHSLIGRDAIQNTRLNEIKTIGATTHDEKAAAAIADLLKEVASWRNQWEWHVCSGGGPVA
jgi:hypothetical protein